MSDKRCSTVIDKTNFVDMPGYDMKTHEANYIRKNYNDDVDMIYAAYKLGFARGIEKAADNK